MASEDELPAATTTFEALPAALAPRILALAPVDARARCAAVRTAWRSLLADPAAWTRLDLSAASGVTCGADVEELLRGAAAKAGALTAVRAAGGERGGADGAACARHSRGAA
jgi:hypothetical protein